MTTAFVLNERLDTSQVDDQLRLDESILGKEQWIERWWYLGEGFSNCLYREGAKSGTRAGHFEEEFICEFTSRLAELQQLIQFHNADQNNSMDYSRETSTRLNAPTFDLVGNVPLGLPTSLGTSGFLLGCNPTNSDLSSQHPSPSQIPFFWQTFVENVMPLIKIFHVPTMGKVMRSIQGRIGSLTPVEEALVFSIYFAAITSMASDEVSNTSCSVHIDLADTEQVRRLLGGDKTTLATQYRCSTEQALSRAQFMTSTDLMTLQAFVLFICCLSQYEEPRFTWNLTALAVRIAQGIGVQDPDPQLSPYEVEARRRLWLCLWLLDFKTATALEADWLIDDNHISMELPLNINDFDLDPMNTEFPAARTGMTDMTHVLVKYELGLVVKRLRSKQGNKYQESLNDESKESLVALCKDQIQVKYLRHCTNDDPLEWLTAANAKLFFATAIIFIYHPVLSSELRSSISVDVRDRLLAACIETLECLHIMETMATSHRRGWLFGTYLHWHVIAFILETLQLRLPEPDVTKNCWNAMDLALGLWATVPGTQRLAGPWPALMELVKKAKEIHQAELDIDIQRYNVVDENVPNLERAHAETSLTLPQHVETVSAILSDVQNSIGSMRHELHSLPDDAMDKHDPESRMIGALETCPIESGPQAPNERLMSVNNHLTGEFADNFAMSEVSFSTNPVFSAAWSFGHPPTQDLAWGANEALTDNSVDNTTEYWVTWNDMMGDLEE
ncbi:hypothetical protein FSARC_7765 [Fusarium sarcochroum]|uniref:Xylanolytic transcriptional activator regulatory domain-containing protein n=1 Tax=Fusarium sarcochroum TaxID=1208366 RepID=A0A8H4TUI3_9HYPO|nr:hypothetical protein FSARC_7765 [Fusarium sarcochroum]